MSSKVLVVFAHSYYQTSRLNKALLHEISEIPGVTLHNLTLAYPDFKIDIAKEQQLLLEHEHIVLQFPFFWYSAPALLKHWLDEVLTYGFAYGDGKKLTGKTFSLALTTGGDEIAYSDQGYNRFNIHDFLKSFDQTAHLCGLVYKEPFLFQGANKPELSDDKIQAKAKAYKEYLLTKLD